MLNYVHNMKTNVELKRKAIEMRKQGFSYKEIQAVISVPKSTLSGWVSNLELTPEQLDRLEEKMSLGRDRARYQAILTNRKKRRVREEKARKEAATLFDKHKDNPFFTLGLSLYWAEGAKKSSNFQFMNSDPKMIRLMVKWVELFLEVPRLEQWYRLFMHKPYADEKCEEFWSHVIRVPLKNFKKTVYKPTPHSVKKNPLYKGCLRVSVRGLHVLHMMIALQKLLFEYYIEQGSERINNS